MKKVEGYFEFRFVTLEENERYTTDRKISMEAKIKDEGFVEKLQMILYHFDKVVEVVSFQYAGKCEKNKSIFRTEFQLEKSGIYWYCFKFKLEGREVFVCRNQKYLISLFPSEYPNEYCWRLKVNNATLREYPEWVGRTIYQIMPDRFEIGSNGITPVKGRKIKDWNDRMPDWKPDPDGIYRNEYFYGGNLQGIKEKLPYIKGLGFNATYLNPICKSRENHHFGAEDFWQIDPMLGDWKDLEELCTEAEKLDIKVICDMAFNHTSDQHEYFKSAIADEKSPYRNFYIFKNGEPVTWYGYKNMPELNKENPDVIKECVEVLKKYISMGVDGFRMDLGDILPRGFLLAIVKSIQKEYPHIIFISEMWDIATDRWNPEIFDGQVNSLMNYPLRDAIIRWGRWGNYEHFLYNFKKIYSEYPMEVSNILMNVISTHDTVTLMTSLVGEIMNSDPYQKLDDIEQPWRHDTFDTFGFRAYCAEHDKLTDEQQVLARRSEKIVLPIFYTAQGNPCMFQGTENCVMGYKDPFCRKTMDWDNPDIDMQEYIKRLNQYREENIDILSDCEPRIRNITKDFLLVEMYNEKGSIILISNNAKRVVGNEFKECKVIFSENSTKDKIGEYGTLILRRDY